MSTRKSFYLGLVLGTLMGGLLALVLLGFWLIPINTP